MNAPRKTETPREALARRMAPIVRELLRGEAEHEADGLSPEDQALWAEQHPREGLLH